MEFLLNLTGQRADAPPVHMHAYVYASVGIGSKQTVP